MEIMTAGSLVCIKIRGDYSMVHAQGKSIIFVNMKASILKYVFVKSILKQLIFLPLTFAFNVVGHYFSIDRHPSVALLIRLTHIHIRCTSVS